MPLNWTNCFLLKNTQRLLRVKLLFFIPALLYTCVILYLSLINLADTPIKELGLSDKVMHAGAYFGLGLLWIFFVTFNFRENFFVRGIVLVVIAAIAFGILIEVLQDSLTSYRQMDFYDVIANSVGVVSAGILASLIKDSLIKVKSQINSFFIKK